MLDNSGQELISCKSGIIVYPCGKFAVAVEDFRDPESAQTGMTIIIDKNSFLGDLSVMNINCSTCELTGLMSP